MTTIFLFELTLSKEEGVHKIIKSNLERVYYFRLHKSRNFVKFCGNFCQPDVTMVEISQHAHKMEIH